MVGKHTLLGGIECRIIQVSHALRLGVVVLHGLDEIGDLRLFFWRQRFDLFNDFLCAHAETYAQIEAGCKAAEDVNAKTLPWRCAAFFCSNSLHQPLISVSL